MQSTVIAAWDGTLITSLPEADSVATTGRLGLLASTSWTGIESR